MLFLWVSANAYILIGGEHSQQVSNTGLHRENERPWQVHTQPPWHDLLRLRLCGRHPLRTIGIAILAIVPEPLFLVGLVCDRKEAWGCMSLLPAHLERVSVGDYTAREEGQGNQKDAGAGVCPRGIGCPG